MRTSRNAMNPPEQERPKPAHAPTPAQVKLRQRVLALSMGSSLLLFVGGPILYVTTERTPVGSSTSKYRDPRDERVLQREAEVLRELRESAEVPAWAGSYYYGDGLATNASLVLAPGAGFSFKWTGCTGLYGENFGDVRVEGARVFLDTKMENHPGEFGSLQVEFVFVPWGNRKYLIEPDRMIAFAEEVERGTEPRRGGWGETFASIDSNQPLPEGRPRLPDEFATAFDLVPIRATVLEVLSVRPDKVHPEDDRVVRVRLSLGRATGAHVKMRLVAALPIDRHVRATIVEVDENESAAEIHVGLAATEPEVGWSFVRVRSR